MYSMYETLDILWKDASFGPARTICHNLHQLILHLSLPYTSSKKTKHRRSREQLQGTETLWYQAEQTTESKPGCSTSASPSPVVGTRGDLWRSPV